MYVAFVLTKAVPQEHRKAMLSFKPFAMTMRDSLHGVRPCAELVPSIAHIPTLLASFPDICKAQAASHAWQLQDARLGANCGQRA